VGHAASSAAGAAANAGRTAQRTFIDTLEREPLIIGAIGLAVGVAMGAALPSTSVEDKTVGPLRDKVLDKTKDAAQAGLDQVRGVAETAYDAVKSEIDHQNGPDGAGTLADKASEVVRASVSAVQDELQNRAH